MNIQKIQDITQSYKNELITIIPFVNGQFGKICVDKKIINGVISILGNGEKVFYNISVYRDVEYDSVSGYVIQKNISNVFTLEPGIIIISKPKKLNRDQFPNLGKYHKNIRGYFLKYTFEKANMMIMFENNYNYIVIQCDEICIDTLEKINDILKKC